MMKIVLTQDVEHLGANGAVVTVRDGYARNYLLPQKMAILATPGALKQAAERQAAAQRRIVKEEAALQGLATRIDGQSLTFFARVGREGRLFGSITAGDIASKLSSQVGEEIDRRRVQLADPIRSIGEHTVHVHLVGRLNPAVKILVEAENAAELEAEAAAEAAATEAPAETEAEPAEA
jgi:large subunit ribosomal protein L9